jgi:hypothetical protein
VIEAPDAVLAHLFLGSTSFPAFQRPNSASVRVSATRRLAVKLMSTPAGRTHDAAALPWRLHCCCRPLDIPLVSLGRLGSGGIRECTIARQKNLNVDPWARDRGLEEDAIFYYSHQQSTASALMRNNFNGSSPQLCVCRTSHVKEEN